MANDDGSYSVQFADDFIVQNGPAPSMPSLGMLKANSGTQTYDIPMGTDVTLPQTVLVWCDKFSVPFLGATIQPVR